MFIVFFYAEARKNLSWLRAGTKAAIAPNTGADGANMIERRAAGRIPLSKGARVDFGPGRGIFAALVRDVSDRGARLQLGGLTPPARFDLSFDNFLTTQSCRPAWVEGGYMGIAFVGPLKRGR